MSSLYLGKTPEKKYVTYREGVNVYPPKGGVVKKRPSPCGKKRKTLKWDREDLVLAVEDYLRNKNLLSPKKGVLGSYGSFMAEDVAEALNAAVSEVRLAVQRVQQKGEFRFMKSNFPPHDIGRNGYAGGSGWRATIYRYWYTVDQPR